MKLKCCAGCNQRLSPSPTNLVCHFAIKGFNLASGIPAVPCGVAYHAACLRVGDPFTCRRRDQRGLHFPKIKHWPIFICECCTVRGVVQRELGERNDGLLLRLERMRILDFANSWAPKTLQAYSSKLVFLTRFQLDHPGLLFLAHPSLAMPPAPPTIGLAWAEELYSLRPSPKGGEGDRVAFSSTRQIRSAAGWHHTAALLIGKASNLLYDDRQKKLIVAEVSMSHEALLGQFTKGLRERIGADATPSWALLDRHVRHFDGFFESNYTASGSSDQQTYWARAGLANLLLWLGWLRAMELFDLRWMDIECIWPRDGPIHDLPENVGCLLLRLQESTKTNRDKQADVPVAFATRTGYKPGRWYQRLHRLRRVQISTNQDPTYIFADEGGTRWTSAQFRSDLVYPLLESLRLTGDPFLSQLHGRTPGMTIPDKFPSMHMYRRGAHTHSEIIRDRSTPRRKATQAERYEHARWSRRRDAERIDVQYRQWALYDRLQITLFCM